ncbi:glycoside hydrolase 5 family protein [Pseudothermotoga thermarum]|uniref:Glycoside hydrolase family 5 n=1 Tax=Pseudothermotoga thermarum DSM 5069 TaxID=688269 RepID=F7YX66_9THEM|nr:cellulase family glycosylhydrolase [Pseudothermotoga thermarum]AEH51033.1 hypothetical protein Theth_0949 [Pseudothermotoga thermarum DSM 5069]
MDFLLGINYWSRSGAMYMWEDEYFNEEVIENEIIEMKNLGMNICRSFLFLPTFFPKPNKISEKHVERYLKFLNLCEEHGLKTLLTFIVGHMSGENFDPPFRNQRDLYMDEFMLQQQCFFVKSIVEKVRSSPAVYGYILSNEMPLYGGTGEPEKVLNWVKKLVEVIKSVDPTRPVGTGDGCWNVFGGENGFNLREISKIVDYLGPHVYLSETDEYRHSMIPEFVIRYLSQYDLPILYEEFGASSAQALDENIALYYREVLINCLINGAIGALGWCLNDFNYPNMKPYLHHPFELKFGIFKVDGARKPAAEEIVKFKNFVDSLENIQYPNAEACILVPSYYNKQYPFSFDDPKETFKHLLQATVLCAKAGFVVDLVEEENYKRWKSYKLIILPSERKYLATTWENLHKYVQAGGNLYISYYWGKYDFHQGIWSQNLESLIGCKLNLRYGLTSSLPSKVKLEYGGLTWKLNVEKCNEWEKSYAPIVSILETAESIELGQSDLQLVKNKVGSGKVFFINFPLEHILSVNEKINLSDLSHLIYRCIAKQASLNLCYCDNQRVRVRKIKSGRKTLYLIQNIAWDKEQVQTIFDNSSTYHVQIELDPKEYKLLNF